MASLVLGGLALTCLAMGFLTGPVMLVVVIFGLRHFGQGLSSHTGVTAAARRFAAERGRAVSIASLGNTAGEALLPVSVVAVLAVMGLAKHMDCVRRCAFARHSRNPLAHWHRARPAPGSACRRRESGSQLVTTTQSAKFCANRVCGCAHRQCSPRHSFLLALCSIRSP